MVSLLENIFQISAVILLICAVYYYRHFKKTKRERKLTSFEFFLDIRYTTMDFETYNEALESDDRLEQYLEYALEAWDREINMDW
ncbi:hypothetical protein [Lysinibacillus endophyticus]|uniref:hypothetical protein n=1 Tax=Ureibacillus endophyticus TaxID=1978490 RepID=UPI0020A136F5|nr:hypothetical protein [Lysinibacillus endophyticus]MCP1144858.1 hypothetical protein [Lysinibacillus endophyticus]